MAVALVKIGVAWLVPDGMRRVQVILDQVFLVHFVFRQGSLAHGFYETLPSGFAEYAIKDLRGMTMIEIFVY